MPNGLAAGGLQPDARVTTAGSPLWLGAALPKQSGGSSGTTNVTVVQNQPKAVLNWKTFNIGASTALKFDQTAGGAASGSWVVLNRVNDPAAQPSKILGTISAAGQVLIVNRNGIIFGAGSQVNVNSLVAATADIADAAFLSNGLYSAKGTNGYTPSFSGASGGIVVEAGARIATLPPATAVDRGGFVWLLGSSVQNDGAIVTNNGQTILAAGQDFILRPGFSTVGNQISTTLGTEVAVNRGGSVGNTGLIQAATGDITLAGKTLVQAGTLLTTTSVGQRGSIHLLTDRTDTAGSITLAPGSATLNLTDTSATTAIDAQRATLISSSAIYDAARIDPTASLLNNQGVLSDRQDRGRVEITTGGTVDFQSNSLTLATGGQIAVTAGRRAFAQAGAVLDVAGSLDILLPASSNVLKVNLQGFELRDSPANRDTGALTSQNVNVDINQLVLIPGTGGSADRYYTAGGLVEVSGELGNVGHTIQQWTVPGGMIQLAASETVAQPGAVFNIAGGSVRYQPGRVATTWLYDATGRLYDIDTAPSNVTYAGVYGGFSVKHARWGLTDIFSSPLVAPTQVYRSGYSVGRDGGSLQLGSPTTVFEAEIDAGVVTGERQAAARPTSIADPFLMPQSTVPLPGALSLANISLGAASPPYVTSVTIDTFTAPIAPQLDASASLPDGRQNTAQLSADLLNAAGLGGLSIITAGKIAIGAPLTVANGGQITLTAPSIHIAATVTARGGSVLIGNYTTIQGIPKYLEPASPPTSPATGASIDVVLSAQGGIDTRGVFTNLALDPQKIAGQAFVNGGAVTIDTSQQVVLAAGSTIDASSGGVVLTNLKTIGGQGGAISITAYDPLAESVTPLPAGLPVSIAGTLRSYGSAKGGALSLRVPAAFISQDGLAGSGAPGEISLGAGLFGSGFSSYNINGFTGVTVAPGTQIWSTQPQYLATTATQRMPTGADPAAAFDLGLAPLYAANLTTATLTQRPGADIKLRAITTATTGGGSVIIGDGAAITVEPGHSVAIEGYGQITVNGIITAPGGAISILNDRAQANSLGQSLVHQAGLSIWLGSTSLLDVSSRSVTALDRFGRPFGVVPQGGTILLGSAGGTLNGNPVSTDAVLVTRPGARLDASGTSAIIDPYAGSTPLLSAVHSSFAGSPVAVASSGGSIMLNTESGADLQGTLRAAAGGTTAQGGTLSVTLVTPGFGPNGDPPTYVVPDAMRLPREVTIAQATQPSALPTDLQPGDAVSPFAIGQAHLSANAIRSGGFDVVAIRAGDLLTFDGSVSLGAGRSISLTSGVIGETSPSGTVRLAAPYVALNGLGSTVGGTIYPQFPAQSAWQPSTQSTGASFTIAAGVIDLAGNLFGGIHSQIALTASVAGSLTRVIDRAGFVTISLSSSSDIRFMPGPSAVAGSGTVSTALITPGNVALTAGQIYPVAGASALVNAGFDSSAASSTNQYLPTGIITIARPPGLANSPVPDAPLTAGGSLNLAAGEIDQGGVLRAPQGNIILGAIAGFQLPGLSNASYTYAVNFLPGSLTSVSAAGQTIPFGGTSDGVSYTVNGIAVGSNATTYPTIALYGRTVTVGSGAVLDLSGGGTLAGAAFIYGRGGSNDVLTTPLLSIANSTVSAPSLATNPVYAILPGRGIAAAPPASTAASFAGSVPSVGDQITLAAGVPGLPAGTYTLMPGSDALLPGAFRIEITPTRAASLAATQALGNGSYAVNGIRGVANTAFTSALPVATIVTSAASVRTYSQYAEQTYSQYAAAQAALFGKPRPALPEDAKTLSIAFPVPPPASGRSFALDGSVKFQPATGGYGGTAIVAAVTDLEVTPTGAIPTAKFASVQAADLNALGASTLSVGGYDQLSNFGSRIDFQLGVPGSTVVRTPGVILRSGAALEAPQVFLTGGAHGITVEQGARISTLGLGAPAYDSSNGFIFNNNGFAVLAVSNGALTFQPATTGTTSGPINIGTCTLSACSGTTGLYADGTVTLVTNGRVTLDPNARFGASFIALAVPSVNIGTEAALAGVSVPAGLTLNQDILRTLLAGDPAIGAPALRQLTLTANQSVNFYGSVDLNTVDPATGQSSLAQLQINSPAIYGAGLASDVVTLTTGTLIWNGLSATAPVTGTKSSALPGGVVAGGAGTGAGTLNLVADRIVLGYGPADQPDTQTYLDRLVLGFSGVNLHASTEITGNAHGTLAVYESQGSAYDPVNGFAHTGGNLTLLTPRLTGAAGSVSSFTAGGALVVSAPAGMAPVTSGTAALGAEIDLTAARITASTAIVLPSGRLVMNAAGDITLASGATLDLAGHTTGFFDQTRSSWGGDVVLASAAGNIVQQPGSRIDISAAGNDAGTLLLTATQRGAGQVSLTGTISGNGAAGYASGLFDVRAQSLDFAALNATLNEGGVFGQRSFDIKTGNLTIGDGVRASAVNVSVDGGSLTVIGTIDASGTRPGSIRLAARDGLTLTGSAVLDAHGAVPQTDSPGRPVIARNRGLVELTSSGPGSVLTLAPGEMIDLSTPDGGAYGNVILNVPRTGAADDAGISATGPVTIRGAAGITVNAVAIYSPTDPAGTISQQDSLIPGSLNLDQIDADSTAYIAASGANAALASRLAGLTAYGAAFHFRPGVEIDSSAASGGNLTVQGDLNLAGYLDPNTGNYHNRYNGYGPAGIANNEPGSLVLRAADNLHVYGSISDGFAAPPDNPANPNPDNNGWNVDLSSTAEMTNSNIVLPTAFTLSGTDSSGYTQFSNTQNIALGYDIQVVKADDGTGAIVGAIVKANFALPANETLGNRIIVPAGIVLTAPILDAGGHTLFAAGTIVAATTVLPKGTILGAGTVLPVSVQLDPTNTIWPAGASLAGFVTPVQITADISLNAGSLIPAGTIVSNFLALRPQIATVQGMDYSAAPIQGLIYASAPMLPMVNGVAPESWSMRLVGGADLSASDSRILSAHALLAPPSGSDPARGSIILSDLHYQQPPNGTALPSWSVIRTGTGNLELLAGADIQEASLYGIYTAGAQTNTTAAFTLARGTSGTSGTVLGSNGAAYEPLVAGYQAYYPDGGGNVLIAAQGNLTGDILVPTANGQNAAINGVGNWLWRQGNGSAAPAVSTAWWINFGTYALPLDNNAKQLGTTPVLTGFTGIGTLGGGNLTITAGGNAGGAQSSDPSLAYTSSHGIDAAIASTGQVTTAADGIPSIRLTGGGDLTIRVGGAINPTGPVNPTANSPNGVDITNTQLNGTLTDLLGNIRVHAGSIGQVILQYGQNNALDPRAVSPLVANGAISQGGLVVVPGEGTVRLDTRGDLVLAGAGDATRLSVQNLSPIDPSVPGSEAAGASWFSLWQPTTAIGLFSAGGNLTPSTQSLSAAKGGYFATNLNSLATDGRFIYPPTLDAVAASGSIYYGAAPSASPNIVSGLELAPSAAGQLQLLAGGSIYANQFGYRNGYPQSLDISGADPATTATPARPGFLDMTVTNDGGSAFLSLFANGTDTASGTLHTGDVSPARFYAGTDIVNLRTGEILCSLQVSCSFASASQLIAATAIRAEAGRDIVSTGLPAGTDATQQSNRFHTTGNLILNNNSADVSVFSAGRDILYANIDIAGPGQLFVSAGRNIYQADRGALESTGALNPNGQTRGGGAGITVQAGVGAAGPDLTAFANLYLNPANQLALGASLTGSGQVAQAYTGELLGFLRASHGYQGNAADALVFFQALPAEQRSAFLLPIYFAELRSSGREFTDTTSPRAKSYARGRESIATLFPDTQTYAGDLTLFGGSGIHTDFGGAINILTPGGQTLLGVATGPQPPASAGVLTQGLGDIGIFSHGNVLLGQSRVFTTFGGSIVIWSSAGDVNAGRGSKSTAVYSPARIPYDNNANITLSPSVPSTGAGIATLSPIPGTSAGDVDLIAPLGTIDAGEAGIRVSGNANLAALTVANATNVQTQGKSSGLPTVSVPNIGAISAASSAAASASQAAQQSAQGGSNNNRQTLSTITVEITGFGG